MTIADSSVAVVVESSRDCRTWLGSTEQKIACSGFASYLGKNDLRIFTLKIKNPIEDTYYRIRVVKPYDQVSELYGYKIIPFFRR
jgi:hypothetical protein